MRACMCTALLLLVMPTLLADAATLGEMQLHATFECIGVSARLDGPVDAGRTLRLSYREPGDEWREAQAPILIEGGRVVGSIFSLAPDTAYEVRLALGEATVIGGMRTRSEAIPTGGGSTIHVAGEAPEGGDGTAGRPFATINEAVRLAGPGDTVLVHPGVYREHVAVERSGSAESYLTIRGEPGAALDGSDEAFAAGTADWERVPDREGVYAASALFETSYIARGAQRLYHFASVDGLAGNEEASIEGGWWQDLDAGKLYLKLPNGRDPSGESIQVGRIRIGIEIRPQAHHVLVEGFEVRNFGGERWGAGVDVRDAAYCVIRGNRIAHCPTAIRVRGTAGHDTLVEDNECTQHNPHRWPWNRVKGTDHEDSGISTTEGYGTVVRRNRIHGYFNGIIASTWGDLENPAYNENVDTYENEIWDIGDDCLEPEGTCTNMRYFRNRMRDCLVGISLAPITRGPCWVIRNTVLNMHSTWLKVSSDTRGPCLLSHNTAITSHPDCNAMNVSGPWSNMTFRNNIIVGTRYVVEDTRSVRGTTWDHDLLYTTRPDGGPIVKWQDVRYSNIDALRDALGFEEHGAFGDPRFVSPEAGDLTLATGSPAIDLGLPLPNINDGYHGKAPDAGAFESGQ